MFPVLSLYYIILFFFPFLVSFTINVLYFNILNQILQISLRRKLAILQHTFGSRPIFSSVSWLLYLCQPIHFIIFSVSVSSRSTFSFKVGLRRKKAAPMSFHQDLTRPVGRHIVSLEYQKEKKLFFKPYITGPRNHRTLGCTPWPSELYI